VGTNGFDVYSDGISEWATYDEATFVYEEVTGDFDKKLRVEFQDLSSQWARAGLIARDVTNFGATRDQQTGTGANDGNAGRYQKVHVNPSGPTLTGPGTAGNNAWELNQRLTTGAATTAATVSGANSNPKYPNAWCRLQRKGQTFSMYRSDNGTDWILLGTQTFDPPMPDKLFVGPEYSPENGNVTDEASRAMWLAKFRDYGNITTTTVPGGSQISFTRTATGLTLTFEGTLESADSITGPWTDVAGASPQTVTTTTGTKFYRAKR
jgi:hypothetical protein